MGSASPPAGTGRRRKTSQLAVHPSALVKPQPPGSLSFAVTVTATGPVGRIRRARWTHHCVYYARCRGLGWRQARPLTLLPLPGCARLSVALPSFPHHLQISTVNMGLAVGWSCVVLSFGKKGWRKSLPHSLGGSGRRGYSFRRQVLRCVLMGVEVMTRACCTGRLGEGRGMHGKDMGTYG